MLRKISRPRKASSSMSRELILHIFVMEEAIADCQLGRVDSPFEQPKTIMAIAHKCYT